MEGGGGGSEGSFLVTPGLGLMIWTLLAFGLTFLVLRKYAFPRIASFLDERRQAIERSIDEAERTRAAADELLEEYRGRLKEARGQADEIVARARKAADRTEEEARADARKEREETMERAKRDIERESRRALDEIRREVADLTIMATEKVTRKSLDDDDHRRLIEEALDDADFSVFSSAGASNGDEGSNGGGSSSGGESSSSGDRESSG